MREALSYSPLLALVWMIFRVSSVHGRCFRQLKEAARAEGGQIASDVFQAQSFNAWTVLKIQSTDSPKMVELKNQLLGEARGKLAGSIPIFFAMFFGLAILAMIFGK